VKYYLSAGAIVDSIGGDLNSTPLQWAVRQGHQANGQAFFTDHQFITVVSPNLYFLFKGVVNPLKPGF
jgi:hypothetical protein